MNSGVKRARIVWRTKSVDVTRVIPRRYATSVGDRRLARARGAADQDDQRHVELVELLVAPKASDRERPVRLAEHLDRQALPSARGRPSACRSRQGPARRGARPRRRRRRRARCASGPSPSGPSSTDARRCRGGSGSMRRRSGISATGSGCAVSASARSSSSRSGWPSSGITSLSANTTGDAALVPPPRATTSIAAALISTTKTSASARWTSSRSCSRSRQVAGDVDLGGAVLVAQVPCQQLGRRRVGRGEERDPLALDRLDRSRAEHGRHDRDVLDLADRLARAPGAESRPRPWSGRRGRRRGCGRRSGSRPRARAAGERLRREPASASQPAGSLRRSRRR